MAWIELKFQTQAKLARRLSKALEKHGALAVTLQDGGDQPIYEPKPGTNPIWDKVALTGLFDEFQNIQAILTDLKKQFPNLTYQLHHLADTDWERTWMQDFVPMKFGERLWIVPSHELKSPEPYHVILDPGLAFGTGKHPTTALCLRWLDKIITGNETVVDYGCGSGILGIAALKLGAKKVYAIDHDPQALLATQDNAKNNSITQKQLSALFPKEVSPHLKVDILIANILANPLIELVNLFAKLLKKSGKIALSGILQEQAKDILTAYESFFEIDTMTQEDEWVCLSGTLKDIVISS